MHWIRAGITVLTLVPCLSLGVIGTAFAAQDVTASSTPLTDGGLLVQKERGTEYRVNPGDELDVYVWGDERLQRTVKVLPDGTLNFPLAGRVIAVNRTLREIADQIRDNLAPNYRETPPNVTVSVSEAVGMRFYVTGKVRTPGSYTFGGPINVLQALSLAGGLADFADVKNAIILRQTSEGQTVEPVRLSKLLKGGRGMQAGRLETPLPELGPGDVLVIP